MNLDIPKARALRSTAMVAVALVAIGCSERKQDPPIEWGAPDEIAQLHFDLPCLLVDQEVKCWAWSSDPVLLGREELDPDGPLPAVGLGGTPTSISTYSVFTRCVTLVDGRIKCWGYNEHYMLALPDPEIVLGDDPLEMGDALPAIDVGGGRAVGVVGVGWGHCAWFEEGDVRCWGISNVGSLGVPDGVVIGDDPDELGDAIVPIDLGDDFHVVGLDGGGSSLCARSSDGRVKCWGNNERGQLGIEMAGNRGGDPALMGDALPAVDLGDSAYVIQVSASYQHACALLEGGTVKCWGAGSDRYHDGVEWNFPLAGRLGQGDVNDRGGSPGQMGDALPPIDLGTGQRAVAISAAKHYTCALLQSGRLKCWGTNDLGQLGLGDDLDRGDEPGEMGDALPTIDLGEGRTVVAFDTQRSSACALLDDESVKCWGYGVGDDPSEMGDALEPVLRAEDY